MLEAREGQGELVIRLAWSPDGQTLASIGAFETLRLWNPAAGELRADLGNAYQLAWSPDGRILASLDRYATMRLWEGALGVLLAVREDDRRPDLGGGTEAIVNFPGALAWSPNGTVLAWGGFGPTVRLWDRITDKFRALPGAEPPLAWSPDGGMLALLGGGGKTVRVWDSATGELQAIMKGCPQRIDALAWSSDGRILAMAREHDTVLYPITESRVCLWDPARKRRTMVELDAGAHCKLAWSQNRALLAGAGYDGAVRLWDQPADEPRVLEGHTRDVAVLAWSPDGRTLASGSMDGTVRLWDADKAKPGVAPGHGGRVHAVAWSPDGRTLASGAEDQTTRLWDMDTGRPGAVAKHPSPVWALAWSPDGRTLASADLRAVRAWDPLWRRRHIWHPLRRKSRTMKGETEWVRSLAWSPDARILASGGDKVRLWDVDQAHCRGTVEHGAVHSLAWFPHGSILASGGGKYSRGGEGTIRLWDSARREHTGAVKCPDWVRRLLSTGWPQLEGHTNVILALAWSADGRTLASGAEDTVRLWGDREPSTDANTRPLGGREGAWKEGVEMALLEPVGLWAPWCLAVLQGHKGVTTLAWCPDGRTLASGGAGGTVRLWDPTTRECRIETYCLAPVLALQFSVDGRILRAADSGAATGNRPIPYLFELCNIETGRSTGPPDQAQDAPV